MSRWLVRLVAVLVVLVPAVLLVWLRQGVDDRLSAVEPDPEPVVLTVQERADDGQRQVTVESVWGEAPVIVAPLWSGTVTDVAVVHGDVVAEGDVVAAVDGVDRVAFRLESPFWRFLAQRDTGPDVVMLQELLGGLGLYGGEVDGVFGRGLVDAVKQFAESLGVVNPSGVFDPGWVIHLGADGFAVGDVVLGVGRPAPPQGSDILIGSRPLVEVVLLDQENRRLVPEGGWVLEVGDAEVGVLDGVVTGDGPVVLAGSLDPDEPMAAGRIRRADPVVALDVPATAVVSAPDGGLCVYVPSGDSFVPRVVEVRSGGVSRVDVVSGLAPGDRVLANPADLFDAPACGLTSS